MGVFPQWIPCYAGPGTQTTLMSIHVSDIGYRPLICLKVVVFWSCWCGWQEESTQWVFIIASSTVFLSNCKGHTQGYIGDQMELSVLSTMSEFKWTLASALMLQPQYSPVCQGVEQRGMDEDGEH